MSAIIRRIPNWLTYFRLLMVPVIVLLMRDQPSNGALLLAAIVFVIAALTDYFDGMIARVYKASSDTGKLLDPLADKILVMSALVMMVEQRSALDGSPWVPGWMVVIMLAREIWVTGLRGVAASRGQVLAASQLGKIKSILQLVGIPLVMFHFALGWGQNMPLRILGLNLLFLGVAFSIWSGIEYTYMVLGQRKEQE